jgi:adenosylcobinamide-GDP ribazoletransferase
VKPFRIALSTLTLFPSSPERWSDKDIKNSVLFYPVIGATIGGVLALVCKLPASNDLQALVTLLLWIILTMAFHLDGLGDCLDGWFGGHNPKERRRIMKDAAIGVYGVTGIVLVLIFKYVLLEHLFVKEDTWKWLIAIPALGRYAVVISCFVATPPPKDQGLGSKVLGLSFPAFILSSFLILGLEPLLKWEELAWASAISLAVSIGMILLSKNRIGGLTGDGMGATIEITEVFLLFLACLHFI